MASIGLPEKVLADALKQAKVARFQILDVVDGGPDDPTGIVEFAAHYRVGGVADEQRERSRFERRAGRWVYLAAEPSPT